MTKKDYQVIARLISTYPGDKIPKDSLIVQLCLIFGADNPRFSAARFEAACGETEGRLASSTA